MSSERHFVICFACGIYVKMKVYDFLQQTDTYLYIFGIAALKQIYLLNKYWAVLNRLEILHYYSIIALSLRL